MSAAKPEDGMPASTLEIIFIGLGEIAQTHLTVLEQIPNIDVVAGVDPGVGGCHSSWHSGDTVFLST